MRIHKWSTLGGTGGTSLRALTVCEGRTTAQHHTRVFLFVLSAGALFWLRPRTRDAKCD